MEENKSIFERFQECVQRDDFSGITDDGIRIVGFCDSNTFDFIISC